MTNQKLAIMKKMLPLALSTAFIVFSCNKESSKNTNQEDHHLKKSSIASDLESLGQGHNFLLDVVADDPRFPDLSCVELASVIGNAISPADPDVIQDMESNCMVLSNQPIGLSDMAEDYYKQAIISVEARNMMFDLENLINNNFPSVASIHMALQGFEANVEMSNSLSSFEKYLLIGSSVIGRYSSEYWINAMTDPMHKWHDVINHNNVPANGTLIVNKDIAGYFWYFHTHRYCRILNPTNTCLYNAKLTAALWSAFTGNGEGISTNDDDNANPSNE